MSRKLSFNRLIIYNFKRFTGKPTILHLRSKPGLHFVTGDNRIDDLGGNGVGKSTLWDALTWVQHGTTVKGERNPDVRPWKDAEQTSVQLDYDIDGHKHELFRTIAPNKLQLDGKPITQEALDRELMSFDIFANAVLFGQGQPLFFDLTPSAKMELLGQVLNLERWDDRSALANDSVKRLQSDELELNSFLTENRAQLETVQGNIKDTAVRMKAWSKQVEEQTGQLQKDAESAEAEMNSLGKQRDDANLGYDGAITEWRPLQKQIREYDQQYQHALAKVFQLRDAQASPDFCPMCKQKIKGHAEHRRKLKVEYEAADKKKNKLLAVLQRLEKASKEFMTKANAAKDALDYYTGAWAEAAARVKVARERLEERSINPFRDQSREYKAERDRLQIEGDKLKIQLTVIRRKIERRLFWVKGFKEIRFDIMQSVLEELEFATNVLLADLGLTKWKVRYLTEKETKSGSVSRNLHVEIYSPYNTRPVPWKSWSGGEGQRLRLIGSLALSDVLLNRAGFRSTLQILDEPTLYLSDKGIDNMVDMLVDHARLTDKRIYYSDHRVMQSSRFASVLRVIKTRTGSELDSGN